MNLNRDGPSNFFECGLPSKIAPEINDQVQSQQQKDRAKGKYEPAANGHLKVPASGGRPVIRAKDSIETGRISHLPYGTLSILMVYRRE